MVLTYFLLAIRATMARHPERADQEWYDSQDYKDTQHDDTNHRVGDIYAKHKRDESGHQELETVTQLATLGSPAHLGLAGLLAIIALDGG